MSDLPVDPAEYPGSAEYEDEREARKQRALRRRWNAYEDGDY